MKIQYEKFHKTLLHRKEVEFFKIFTIITNLRITELNGLISSYRKVIDCKIIVAPSRGKGSPINSGLPFLLHN